MVLTDSAIKEALKEGRLDIDPRPEEDQYDPTSVDLRLGSEFQRWDLEGVRRRFGEVPAIRIGAYDYTRLAADYLQPVALEDNGCVTLNPQSFMLALTLERVAFRSGGGLAGRVEGKSSLARLGLSVHFAPTLHATWEGHITLELMNVGPAPLHLTPGAKICQLVVESISGTTEADMAGTRFQNQESPRGRVVD